MTAKRRQQAAARSTGRRRYAIYCRCSSDDQAHGDFTTVDVQRELNRAFVAGRGEVAGDYADEGRSGTNLSRPDWKRLLADAQAGRFDAVVVTYMSRLARGDAYHVAEYLLKEAGVAVETVKEDFAPDLAGHVGKSMTIFMDGMYPKMVSQWTRTKMEAMVAAGHFPGGFPPFGFEKVWVEGGQVVQGKEPPKRLVPHPEQAPLVREAFALFLRARSLSDVGAYLRRLTDRAWRPTSVRNLLENEVYLGVLQFGDWRNESAYEAVVTREIFDAAQDALASARGRGVVRQDREAHPYTYYLRGKVVCGHCGCACTQAAYRGRSGPVHYYVCLTKNRGGACPIGMVNADRLHRAVLDVMRKGVKSNAYLLRVMAESGGWEHPEKELTQRRGELAKRLQFLDLRANRYVAAIGEGRALESLVPALEKVEAERVEVRAALAEAEKDVAKATVRKPTSAEVRDYWRRVLDAWDMADDSVRESIMRLLVGGVELRDKEKAALEILAVPGRLDVGFGLHSLKGAGVGLEPTTSGL